MRKEVRKAAFILMAVVLMTAFAVPASVGAVPVDDPATPNFNEALIDHNTTFYVVDAGWGPTSSVTHDCANGWGDDDWELTLTQPYVLQVTVEDCCWAGDYYEVWVDGVVAGMTPPVPVIPEYGHPLSAGNVSVYLGAGVHTIEIRDAFFDTPAYPAGYCPAGYTVTGTLFEFEGYSTCLNAGQDMEVGVVNVWNDPATLYVQYLITDPDWFIAETHLAVADSVEGIPQTKKGNPIPGQFEYSMYHDPMVQQCTYEVPLSAWDACTLEDIVVAAHASVVRAVDDCWETVWQIGDEETYDCEGDLTNYADEFNWGDPAGPCAAGPGLAAESPAYTDPFVVGTTPTDEFPYNSNYNRDYATDFDVEWSGSLPLGGELTVSWSPGQSDDETKIVSGDGIAPAVFQATGTPQPGNNWFLDTYPLVEQSTDVDPLASGTHTINFQHTEGDGTFWDWIRLEKPCEQWETAWGCGTFFSEGRKGNANAQRNWATYITYHPQCWIELSADAFATSEPAGANGVHLWINNTPPAPQGTEARIYVPVPSGTTLGDIEEVSWMAYVVAGYAPHVDVLLDVNGGDALVFEYAYNTVAGHVPEGWPDYGVTQDTWFQTFGDDYPDGLLAVDDTALAWLASGPPGPPPPGDPGNFGTLADWKAGMTYGPVTVDSNTPVIGINIEIDNWIPQPAQTEAYVKDVAVTFAP